MLVTILNNNDKESVVMGRGIAFQKKKGDEIDDTKVEKIFVLENNNVNDKFLKLINDILVECIEVAEEIISYAEENLETTLNQDMPDLLISNYSLIDSSYNENDTLTLNNIENNQIKGTLNYNTQEENYSFEPFTIRIYFEWYEGENELMDDISDTQVTNTQNNLQIKANIQFTQKI